MQRVPNTKWRGGVRLALLLAIGGSLAVSARPAAAITSTVRVQATSASDSNPVKSATATCPGTHPKLIGTGAEVINGNGQVIMDDITPNAFLTQVLVRAREGSGGYAGNWSVRAHGICTNLNTALTLVSSTSAQNGTSPKSATATCAANKTLVGTAAAINSGFGDVALDDILPHSALNAVTAWGVELAGNQNWSVTAYAICSDLPGILLARVSATNSNDIPIKSATVSCPSDYSMLGTGAELFNSGGNAVIDDITPNGSGTVAPTAVTVWAIERQDGPPWSVKAWAICLSPPET